MTINQFARIGKDYQEVVLQTKGEFLSVTDSAALRATQIEQSASDILSDVKGKTVLPANELSAGLAGIKDKVTGFKDGTAIVKDLSKFPRDIMESAKDSLFGAANEAKAAFGALPKSVQAAAIGNTGILSDQSALRLPGYNVTSNYANFFNKLTDGSFALNPKSFKRDVKSLAGLTKSALTNGVFGSVASMASMLGGKPNSFSGIMTRVAMGAVLSKNSKGLLKMGVSLGGINANGMSISAGKTAMVRTAFKEMALPKIKGTELAGLHSDIKTTAKVLDANALIGKSGAITAASFVDMSLDMKKVLKASTVSSSANVTADPNDLNVAPTMDGDSLRDIAAIATNIPPVPDGDMGSSFA